jgi:hypothetical protein
MNVQTQLLDVRRRNWRTLSSQAESIVARDFAATKQETNSPENQKDTIIEVAAKKLGIPII